MRQFVRYRIVSFSRPFQSKRRWALNFDGVGVRGQLANRAINPDGDNTFEFWSPNVSGMSQTIVSQNISDTGTAREFHLYVGGGANIAVIWGGAETNILTTAQGYEPNKKYWLKLVGNSFSLAKDTEVNVIRTGTFVKGAAREPLAQTVIGARTAGSISTYSIFSKGIQRDVRINGKLYPMRDYNQAIQLPLPDGLGDELITPYVLENPFVRDSQWTYLGNGRWQYAGDGTLNEIIFVAANSQPNAGYVEFEIEQISGVLTCSQNALARSKFSDTGIKRFFFTDKNENGSNGATISFKRADNTSVTCIIKNISFKPLGTCNPMTISTATSTNWVQVVNDYEPKFRKVLRFDGVGVRGVLANRAIDVEAANHSFEFMAPTGDVRTIIAQNISISSKEFHLFTGAGGRLDMTYGSITTTLAPSHLFELGKRYWLTITGSNYTLAKGQPSNIVISGTFTRGTVREPLAPTVIGARCNDNATSFAVFGIGPQYDLKINGTIWPIADRNQAIQLPEPSGLGAELITQSVLENPAAKGSQWTYLGNGRWRYVGDSSINALRFLTDVASPTDGFIEFEVESISGGAMRCTGGFNPANSFGDKTFSTIGVKRSYYVGFTAANQFSFARNGSSDIVSCIIKNISFKPLGTCNPITLANVTSANWEDLEI